MDFARALSLPIDSQTFLDETKAIISNRLVEANFAEAVTPEVPELSTSESRDRLYRIWWAYFTNHIYDSKTDGGYRDLINKSLGSHAIGNLAPLFNPVERAVRSYEYVFDGKFGEDILIDDNVAEKQKVNAKAKAAIEDIWNWSHINEWKNKLLVRTAALGTCGLRIVYRNDNNGKRVLLIPEHPSLVRFVEKDERGNITQLVLEYDKVEGEFFGEDENKRVFHHYLEYMSKEKFWMVRDGEWWDYTANNGKGEVVDTKEKATIPNRLGFVPYVFIMQTDLGGDFGVPCFYGQERRIDHLNALAAHINHQIHKHVVPTWVIEAAGPEPEFLEMGDQSIWYIHRDSSSGSQFAAHDLVSKLSLSEAITQQTKIQEELTNSIPEMKATDGQFLSHQSGGTVAHLRLPAEQRILGARNNIEFAFVKAQKIALSIGIFYGIWDLGTGTGSRTAADDAYANGLEDHKFNKRPALPLTVDDDLTVAKAKQADAAAENPTIGGVQGGNNRVIPSPNSGSSTTS